ncbi:MAG TPA: hypothetical protein VGV91_08860 [Rubrobacter sp.]|nr:hypothetical protein [Rubrobacter sp.]
MKYSCLLAAALAWAPAVHAQEGLAQEGPSWTPLTCAEVERGSLEAELLDCGDASAPAAPVEPEVVEVPEAPPAAEVVTQPPAPAVVEVPEPPAVETPVPEVVNGPDLVADGEVGDLPGTEVVNGPDLVGDGDAGEAPEAEGLDEEVVAVEPPPAVEAPDPDLGDAAVVDEVPEAGEEVAADPVEPVDDPGEVVVLEEAPPEPPRPTPPPMVEVEERDREDEDRDREERAEAREEGGLKIPNGHRPPPGSCRVWFPDRPPGHQPPPGPCDVDVPAGAVLIVG